MVKIVLIIITLTIIAISKPSQILNERCLNCHTQQKIPTELIYRRYLMKYSTNSNIKEKIYKYMKNPKKEYSIMPKQFFLKFTMKEKIDINDNSLNEGIDEYLKYFDVKNRFSLE